ncbi:MAG: YdcF family protein [Hydrogenophilales bacterium]|nr:YdcF family protein [Hydrogenophilales bacterium]
MDQHTTWLLSNLLAAALLPPLSLILLSAFGWILLKRHPRLGKSLITASFTLLYLLASPLVADHLLGLLEKDIKPLQAEDMRRAEAIVILAGGAYRDAPEYGQDSAGVLTLARLQYGAHLHRVTGLPILVTGGNPEEGLAEAQIMRQTLEEYFGVRVKWVEARAFNTAQNARFSAEILMPAGIKKVLVVSHAWHMPRARYAFEKVGMHFLPAPTRFANPPQQHDTGYSPLDFIPNARALEKSYFALHELIGLVWYRLTL